MVRIMLPLVKSTIFAVAIMVFIGFWNDYQIPMLYIPSWATVAYGLFQFSNIGEEGAFRVHRHGGQYLGYASHDNRIHYLQRQIYRKSHGRRYQRLI